MSPTLPADRGPDPVRYRGRTGLAGETIGRGFLLAATTDARQVLTAGQFAFLDRTGARVIRLISPDDQSCDDNGAVDTDAFYPPHLAEAGQAGALVRPDHYVFGTEKDLPALADGLRRQLTSSPSADAGDEAQEVAR